MKRNILFLCTVLAISQTIYSLQPASKQLVRVAPRAAQAARPAATRALGAQAAALRPSLVRPITTVPALAAARPYYEQSWQQQQSGNTGGGGFGKLFYASPLITVGILAENKDREPLTFDQARDLIHEHAEEVVEHTRWRLAPVQFSWLPGYIIKKNCAERRAEAKKLRDCIVENNLDLLVVPQKMPIELLDGKGVRYELCICERIEGMHEGRVNESQMRQLITLLEKVECLPGDLKPDNVMFTKDGRIAFIDTEFAYPCRSSVSAQRFLDSQLHQFKVLPSIFLLEPAAEELLEKKIYEIDPEHDRVKRILREWSKNQARLRAEHETAEAARKERERAEKLRLEQEEREREQDLEKLEGFA